MISLQTTGIENTVTIGTNQGKLLRNIDKNVRTVTQFL